MIVFFSVNNILNFFQKLHLALCFFQATPIFKLKEKSKGYHLTYSSWKIDPKWSWCEGRGGLNCT